MSADIRELIPLYALGALAPDEAAAVERAVAGDPALAAELDAYRETAHRLVELVAPVAPAPEVEARLLASTGGGRFERFAARMSQLFDVTVDRARELLGLAERSASWEAMMAGVTLVHFDGGAACAGADCGFVKIAAGCTFPWHTHRGEEVNVVLVGTLRDHTGRLFRPGDELVQAAGSSHDIAAHGGEDVVIAVRVFDGVDVAKPS